LLSAFDDCKINLAALRPIHHVAKLKESKLQFFKLLVNQRRTILIFKTNFGKIPKTSRKVGNLNLDFISANPSGV
jgi:hypothetical protein